MRREEEYTVCGQYSKGGGGAGEKKKIKTESEVVGKHQEQLVGKIIVRGSAIPD